MKRLTLTGAIAAALLVGVPAAIAVPTASQYKTQVNAICKAGLVRLNAIAEPSSPKDYATYADKQATVGYDLLQKILAVKPPVALQPLVLKAAKPQGQAVDALLVLRDTIKKGGDPQKSLDAALPKINALTAQADAAWKAAGLTACAA